MKRTNERWNNVLECYRFGVAGAHPSAECGQVLEPDTTVWATSVITCPPPETTPTPTLCPPGEYLKGQTCTRCSSRTCTAGAYRAGSCSGEQNGYMCRECDNVGCGDGTYRTGTCAGTANGYTCKAGKGAVK